MPTNACPTCFGRLVPLMRYCPHCQTELDWGPEDLGCDARDGTGDFVAWGTSKRFSFSPWTGEEYDGAPLQAVKRAAGFDLRHECEDAKCKGQIAQYMRFCPTCGKGAGGRSGVELAWTRETLQGERDLAGFVLDENCGVCSWELHSLWKYCPWCGDRRYELDPSIEENLRRLAALGYEDEASLLRQLSVVAATFDFAHPAIELRRIIEVKLTSMLEDASIEVKASATANDKLQLTITNSLLRPRQSKLSVSVTTLGNDAAHSRVTISREDFIDALRWTVSFLGSLGE